MSDDEVILTFEMENDVDTHQLPGNLVEFPSGRIGNPHKSLREVGHDCSVMPWCKY
jgi:hypothetical protein